MYNVSIFRKVTMTPHCTANVLIKRAKNAKKE
jgi:hypothetical protein